jgi:hypothetical protein
MPHLASLILVTAAVALQHVTVRPLLYRMILILRAQLQLVILMIE